MVSIDKTGIGRLEAASILECSVSTIDNYLRTGKLTKYRRARSVIIDRREVEALKAELNTIVKEG